MTEYEKVVEDIRVLLSSSSDPQEDALREVDERYANCVQEVNARLRECDALLADGLRSEALLKCEIEPNLLAAASLLDFPEREVWADYVRQFGLAQPPVLLTDVAEHLNEAYVAEASLGDLLRQHRLLALARAALPERINMLRKIAARDSGNPAWLLDLRSYEQVRHGQFPAEVEYATSHGDLRLIASLEQEIRAPDWLLPPPADVAQQVIRTHTELRVSHARVRLQALVEELNRAFSDLDVARGRTLRSQWNAQRAIAIERDDDPILDLVAPALQWLLEEDQREEAEREFAATLHDTEQALDDGQSASELERLQYRLGTFDQELPADLMRRLSERLESLALERHRRNRLIILSALCVVLLAGAAMAFGLYRHSQSQLVHKHEVALRQLLEDQKHAAAADYLSALEQQAPDVRRAPEVEKIARDISAAQATETQRQERLQRLLAASRETLERKDYPAARAQLNDAEQIAVNDVERSQIDDARGEIDRQISERQQQLDEAFAADFLRFSQQCENVPLDPDAIANLVREGEVLQQRRNVSTVLTEQVKPLLVRLQSRREALLKNKQELDALTKITAAVGRREQFRQALEAYADAFPQSPRAVSFRQVLEKEPAWWEALERWDRFVELWSQQDFRRVSPVEAKEKVEQVNKILAEFSHMPGTDRLRRLVEYMTAIANRFDENGQEKYNRLVEVFSTSRSMVGLGMVSVGDGIARKRYYFDHTQKPKRVSGALIVERYVDLGFQDTKSIRISEALVVPVYDPNDPASCQAPQSRFVKAALDQFTQLSRGTLVWERAFLDLFIRLEKPDEMLDPLVRLQLLTSLLPLACEGSLPLQTALRKHLELLRNSPVDPTANWVDPDDPNGSRARALADDLLNRARTLGTAEEVTRRAGEVFQEMDRLQFSPRHRWFGWLQRDSAANWTCTVEKPPPAETPTELVLLVPGTADPWELRSVGTWHKGQVEWRANAAESLKEGRPVFARLESRGEARVARNPARTTAGVE